MINYKYHLQKYAGASTLHTCPGCGCKYSFTYYVNENNQFISEICGRCNRDSCNYHLPPHEFFKTNPQAVLIPQTPAPQIKKEYYAAELVKKTISEKSTLINFLKSKLPAADVAAVVKKYAVGATKDKAVIFWNIDKNKNVRKGKIMYYHGNGHRIKTADGRGLISSARIKLNRAPESEYESVFFGLHLTNNNKTICIVESEKTALICAVLIPEFVWLATGSINNLTAARLADLKDKKIIYLPDFDGFAAWQQKTEKLKEFVNTKFAFSYFIKVFGTGKEDVADVILSNIKFADLLKFELQKINQTLLVTETSKN